MSENPNVLISEATRVVEDCERYLAAAEELVTGIPRRREAAMERLAAARERQRQAREDWRRVIYDDDDAEEWGVREAEREMHDAGRAVHRAEDRLGSDDLDPESRKAVARHLAALVREDSERRLRVIGGRSDNPEVQRTVADSMDQVGRSVRYLISRFEEARNLHHREVSTTRAEAHAMLDRLKNPPVDLSPEP
jgi:hypothetical protein